MRGLWMFAAVVIAILGFAFWWLMPLKVERKLLGNIAPNFQSWCATDLDNDNNPELLLSYDRKPPVLAQIKADGIETTTLHGVDTVVLPSSDQPQGLLLPTAKSVPAKAKGQFGLMRLEKGLISLHEFPKVERPDHVVWLDADSDGKFNDLIVRSGEKRFWFVMDENGEWKFKAQLPSGAKRPLIGLADLDGDGKPELVTGAQHYSVLWGDGKPETKLGSRSELTEVQLADLENDGQMEIVALKREPSFSRLVVWRFNRSQNRLVLSTSSQIAAHIFVTLNGQKIRVDLDNLRVEDLDSDNLKEVIVYASDRLLHDFLHGFLVRQLKIWIFPGGSIAISPSLPPQPKVSFANSSWLLISFGSNEREAKEVETMKWAHQPITCLRFRGQNLVLTEQRKYVRKFRPQIHSFSPLILIWWEEGVFRGGTLWRLDKTSGAKEVRCGKVLELPGSPKLVADLNGDGSSEILWLHEFCGSSVRLIVGITTWKFGRWRKVAWDLPTAPLPSILFSSIHMLPFCTTLMPPTRIIPIKVGKGFDILIVAPNGAVERVRVK